MRLTSVQFSGDKFNGVILKPLNTITSHYKVQFVNFANGFIFQLLKGDIFVCFSWSMIENSMSLGFFFTAIKINLGTGKV